MDEQRRAVPLSRRQFLSGAAALAGATLLAACGGPAAEPTKPAAGGQAATAPAGGAAPQATAVAAAGATPTKDLTIVSGKFNVWFSANWNTVTDEAVGNVFVDCGKQNNIQVEWQTIPGSPLILQKDAAALAAGQPPEVDNNNQSYWYSQGEMGDLKDLVGKYKDKAGGMYPIGVSSLTAQDGGVFAVPYAVDVWPAHWRIDVIGEKNNG